MPIPRQAYETGHAPKCLVLIDDTAECKRAVSYASRWARRARGGVVMLRVIEILDRNQQWRGVADIMLAEAREDAEATLDRASLQSGALAGITPERVIREGLVTDTILDVIDKDADIVMLVLAASAGAEGPGPVVTATVKAAGSFPIPVVIVPAGLSDAELDALT